MITSKQTNQLQAILTSAHNDFEKGMNLYAFFKTSNHAMSEDLVQDTFIKTWRYLVKGGKIELMKSFLYHILNNLIVDQYRKHKTVSLDVLLQEGFQLGDGRSDCFFNILDGKAAIILIQSLPEKYRKVMLMKYVQDMSISEISLLTGQSKNTIAVQVHRGLEKLKQFYA